MIIIIRRQRVEYGRHHLLANVHAQQFVLADQQQLLNKRFQLGCGYPGHGLQCAAGIKPGATQNIFDRQTQTLCAIVQVGKTDTGNEMFRVAGEGVAG